MKSLYLLFTTFYYAHFSAYAYLGNLSVESKEILISQFAPELATIYELHSLMAENYGFLRCHVKHSPSNLIFQECVYND